MSKFCGIYHFDTRPVSTEDQARVRTALNSPGCFTPLMCRQPGLVMGWAAGSDAPHGHGPFESSDGSICLWDGRIDNRKDLVGQTGVRADRSDAALIMSLYQQRGTLGLRDVVGDWSLCVWDANSREIVLASDYAGIRPLYYHRSAVALYWSSSLADLVGWTGIAELDDTYVASFLKHGSACNRTPYAGIVPVPAGHAVSIASGGIDNRAFWTLPILQEIRYRDERQYEEHMLELFRESVQSRLAAGAPTCAELSGGLDSSSIVCMADRLQKESGNGSMITLSYTHENSPDERFFREVERACNLSGCHLPLQEYPAAAADRAGAAPGWWEPRFRGLAGRMAAMGSSVLLTGQCGDLIMGNTADDTGDVTEWLAQGHFGRAAHAAYAWGRSMQVPIYPIFWRSVREAYFSRVPPVSGGDPVGAMRAGTEDSLGDGLSGRLRSYEQELLADDPSRHAPPGRRRRFRSAAVWLQYRKLQTPEALQHLSCTHPYAHRPLVEFMLTIPSHIVFGPGQPRRLMRRSFAGLLPPLILTRKSKGAYTSMYRGALMPLAKELLKDRAEIQLVERGYVERRSLVSRLERFTQGLDCNETQLQQVLLFEFWLQNRAASPRPSEPLSRSATPVF